MDVQQMIFMFAGGLGIFLFGLKYMGDGLQKSAGESLRSILNQMTSTPVRAIIAGIVVTVLIQSSSGTTVLAVGLVSAGFMKIKQAIGVIMGANIGTTITAFIIGIDIGAYALPIMAVGAFLLFFFKNMTVNSIGQIIFGFGALFYGLELMGEGMYPLREFQAFKDLMINMGDNPILGVGVGTIFTWLVQSSSGSIGILQELYSQGQISIEGALPVLFGNNIGTTITAVLAAIGASVPAKRTAASHIIFNLVGTFVVIMAIRPFTSMIVAITPIFNLNPAMQIAVAHGLFNVTNVLIQMWFIGYLAKLVTKLIPGDDAIIEYDSSHLDFSIITTVPSVALNQAKLEIKQMGDFVLEEYKEMFKYYKKQDDLSLSNALQLEEVVNDIDMRLTEYLMHISVEDLPVKSSTEHTQMMDITKYLERIGDHSENILNNIKEAARAQKKLAKKTNKEPEKIFHDDDLMALFNLVEQNITDAITSFTQDSYVLAGQVIKREKEVNRLEEHIRKKYIQRLNSGAGLPSDGILFVDIVSNLERMSDHSAKIAKHSLGIRYPFQHDSKRPRYAREVEGATETK
ncbi:MAG: Na/Pi cotransporter family protein [Alkalibacterium sp.]|uniref:Phosphate:Na+ symporter n=2 Tax=Alkalibacterium gilvum TaxID=1130080 RepID=A0A1H6SX92_9LACT|nr:MULTISPECIES: Na/Pi cotransporter family protein [Alkalibacterium]MDN6293462.1 Na/Pi cotransporter family protein [Alkalibacterium sp.]MDN6296350.1 Na/Pi cotransporter family protein [Alkalibacterium sp.]MDN6327529.1 Na/Pi cotransporter family protein [Alkalibacterium sp.]MDN6385716.1 Na/Pi cotransporter family protein [Alkalibacterium sp.]MDN6730492.1 Na/Pi cotransporter family protein [Alkalibacterium sp.]